MFQITVREAAKVPGHDYFHIIGINSKGDARIGDYITDGNLKYEITSIPFVRRSTVKPAGEVDICIKTGNYLIEDIVGKTLYTV